MKIGLFDPYLDTLGGGERYTLTLAEHLASGQHQVELFWPNQAIIKKAQERFNLDLSGVKTNSDFHTLFTHKSNLFKKIKKTSVYDLIFYLSDGSIPLLTAKIKILHFQVPFTKVQGRSLGNQIKLKFIEQVVCNSQFTKKFIDQEYGVKSLVIYPPVATEEFSPGEKQNLILSVGRFSPTLNSKKQAFMIKAFKKMIADGLSGWQLVLVGGVSPENESYFNKLKQLAASLPIKLFSNLPFGSLKEYYSQAKIYWHAAGFNVDEDINPEKVEHFGMTTVEAMAAGCVPIVCGKGGQKEIVTNEKDGFLWHEKDQLIYQTLKIASNEELREKIAQKAMIKSHQFNKKTFCQNFEKLIFK